MSQMQVLRRKQQIYNQWQKRRSQNKLCEERDKDESDTLIITDQISYSQSTTNILGSLYNQMIGL